MGHSRNKTPEDIIAKNRYLNFVNARISHICANGPNMAHSGIQKSFKTPPLLVLISQYRKLIQSKNELCATTTQRKKKQKCPTPNGRR